MNKQYLISLIGCDDTTHMVLPLTEEEYELIKELEILSIKMSTYSCMPTLKIVTLDRIKHKPIIEDMLEIINNKEVK